MTGDTLRLTCLAKLKLLGGSQVVIIVIGSWEWWAVAACSRFLRDNLEPLICLFNFSLFLFQINDLGCGWRYFGRPTLLFCLRSAVVAWEGEVLNIYDLSEDDSKALSVKPLLTDVTSDHVRWFKPFADAIKGSWVTRDDARLVTYKVLTFNRREYLTEGSIEELRVWFAKRLSCGASVGGLASFVFFHLLLLFRLLS